MTEDEMAGWHHWLDGRESEWTPGIGDGQGAWCAPIHGVAKSRTQLSDWTELKETRQLSLSFLTVRTSVMMIWVSGFLQTETLKGIWWMLTDLTGKDTDVGKDWRQEEKGMTEDKIVGWHHWLDGHEYK